jgi:hypothetical protein
MAFINSATKRQVIIAILFVAITIYNWDDRELLRALRAASSSLPSSDNENTYKPPSSSSSSSSLRADDDGPIATVAYVISTTKCTYPFNPYDQASVLRRSIQLNSYPKHPTSKYAAKFYVFVNTPNATAYNYLNDRCGKLLSLAGWDNIIPQESQIYPALIKEPPGSMLKQNIGNNGCCGHAELIKLATYKLTNHEIAVHLDLDTLVTNPFDELYNVMMYPPDTPEGKLARKKLVEVVAPTDLNRRIMGHPSKEFRHSKLNVTAEEILANITVNAYYTKDYNMISPDIANHVEHVGVQGGFLVVRPSKVTYLKMRNLIYSGEYYGMRGGWFKQGYGGHIWGSMTIQGFLGHYFDHVDRDHSIELNRCRYNSIAENARTSSYAIQPKFPRGSLIAQARNASAKMGSKVPGELNYYDKKCHDGRKNCDDVDCQRFPVEETRMVHFTYCKDPFKCYDCDFMETYKEVACYSYIKEWFRVRSTLPAEDIPHMDDNAFRTRIQYLKKDGTVDVHEGNCYKEYTFGYCQGAGKYIPLKERNFSSLPDDYVVSSDAGV